jgi:hypothetical protein
MKQAPIDLSDTLWHNVEWTFESEAASYPSHPDQSFER